jgi:protein-S-isoprenylcysteine O-methyltransferase Ste14
MGKEEAKENILNINQHVVLAYSYSVYFVLFLVGVFLDLIFNIKIFNFSLMVPVGIALILLATLLIFWAQRTSRNLEKETLTKESFCKGPYRFTRSPTHWGLFFLMLGFGIIINAIFIIISTFISFILTKFIFLKREETILEKKYGTPYLEYKQSVKL